MFLKRYQVIQLIQMIHYNIMKKRYSIIIFIYTVVLVHFQKLIHHLRH